MFSQVVRNKYLLVWLVAFTCLVFLGNVFLPDIMSSDSMRIQDIKEGFVEPGGGSYAATAIFFSLFPAPLDIALILVVGWVSLSMLMLRVTSVQANLLAWYMTIPAILTCMIRPQKETIVILLAILVTWLVTHTSLSRIKKIILIAAIYAFYAAFFRTYFFLIIAAFAGVYLMLETRKWLVASTIALVGIVVVLLMPVDILYKLQSPRDLVNYTRIGSGLEGHRTAFMNPYPIDTVGNFILNYVYAFVRMNIPVVFDMSAKAWFWLGSVICYVYVMVKGLKQSTEEIRILSSLFLAHVLVLILFEPDTGSYTRHATSVFIYMAPSLAVVNNYFQGKKSGESVPSPS